MTPKKKELLVFVILAGCALLLIAWEIMAERSKQRPAYSLTTSDFQTFNPQIPGYSVRKMEVPDSEYESNIICYEIKAAQIRGIQAPEKHFRFGRLGRFHQQPGQFLAVCGAFAEVRGRRPQVSPDQHADTQIIRGFTAVHGYLVTP